MNYPNQYEKEQEILMAAQSFFKNGYLTILPSLIDEAFPDTLHENAWYLSNWHTDYALYDIDFVEYVNNLWMKFMLSIF